MGNRQSSNNDKQDNKDQIEQEQKHTDAASVSSLTSSLTLCPLMIPFWRQILECDRILIAGCGGGYDCFQGIPLYFALKELGKEVFIANYTMVENLSKYKFNSYKSLVYQVNYKKKPNLADITKKLYFPEYYLSKWFADNENIDITIYAFDRWGVKKLHNAYNILCNKLNIDGIIVVDGGTDSLMDGMEFECGTICEDYTSMFAAYLVSNNNIKHKIHCILGLGVDRFHHTSDVSSWRAIAELQLNGGFLGSLSLMNNMKCVVKYRSASEYCYKYMQKSIVGTSILDAIEGRFGDYHSNDRTKNTKLFINPAMSLYFFFDLKKCIDRIHPKYLELMKDTTDNDDATAKLLQVRTWLVQNNKVRIKHEDFPKTTDF